MQAQETAQQQGVTESARPRGKNMRWEIAALLGVGILINYFDRVNLTVATAPIKQDFHLTGEEISNRLPLRAALHKCSIKSALSF